VEKFTMKEIWIVAKNRQNSRIHKGDKNESKSCFRKSY
jgi:hypothetical protein